MLTSITWQVKASYEPFTNRFLQNKIITSVYSKSSNSLGFNPILQKFCEMICEIISSKTVCGIFLIFCRLHFIKNFVVNNFPEPKNHQKLNISRPIYLLKNFYTPFWRSYIYNFFFFFFFNFSMNWSFFSDCKTIHLGVIFCTKN